MSQTQHEKDRHTVTFIADSPVDGGWQERPRESHTELQYWAAVLSVGAVLGCVLWCYLAIRLTLFAAVE